jgi:uncharacterized membrane protein YjgN (DUF898 family)
MAMPLMMALIGLGVVGIAIALMGDDVTAGSFGWVLGLLMLVVYIVFPIVVMPLFHVQWQRFSHQHSHFGSVQFGFTATFGQYVKAYLHSFGVFIGLLVVFGTVAAILASIFLSDIETGTGWMDQMPLIIGGILLFYALLFAIQPYMKALFFNLAWNNTQIAGQSFRSTVSKWGMVKLGTANLLLTVLTLGFFRPFAVIRTQRYLLENLHLDLEAKGIVILNAMDSHEPAATAEGALDLLGDLDM